MKQRHLIHLHWRSGFGIKPSSLQSAKALNKKKNVNSIFESSKKIEPIQIDLSEFDGAAVSRSLEAKGIKIGGYTGGKQRLVTHLGISAKDIRYVVKGFEEACAE